MLYYSIFLLFSSAMGGPPGLCPNASFQNGSSSARKDSWTKRGQACISRQTLGPAGYGGDSRLPGGRVSLFMSHPSGTWQLKNTCCRPQIPIVWFSGRLHATRKFTVVCAEKDTFSNAVSQTNVFHSELIITPKGR